MLRRAPRADGRRRNSFQRTNLARLLPRTHPRSTPKAMPLSCGQKRGSRSRKPSRWNTWSAPRCVQSTDTGSRQKPSSRLGLDPDVAVDARGNTIAVWQNPAGVQAAIQPAVGSWLAPQTVASPGGEEPQIASDASGDVTVVSTRQAPGHSTGIQAVVRPAGGTFSPVQIVSAPGNDFYPRLAENARGDAFVAWDLDAARGCLVVAAFRPANGRWSKPRVLSDTHAGCPSNKHVAIDARGDGVVAWVALRGRTQFVETAGRSASGRWTIRHTLAEGSHLDETVGIGMDARGDVMVVWREEALNRGRSAIWARIRPAGRGWETARTISRTRGGPPSLAIDARGDALVTWQDERGIEAAARPAGGPWEKPHTVSVHERGGPGAGDDGRAALDARGDALATGRTAKASRQPGTHRCSPDRVLHGVASQVSVLAWTARDRATYCDGIHAQELFAQRQEKRRRPYVAQTPWLCGLSRLA
jgi:hypothetical protein